MKNSKLEDKLKDKRNRFFGAELLRMLIENKKYWMIPMLLILFLFGLLILASNSPIAPFIYTLW
tara:strand:+ start:1797 stop:1988 length:192 start_codon:yes stop_codon:yes gene_type:complete